MIARDTEIGPVRFNKRIDTPLRSPDVVEPCQNRGSPSVMQVTVQGKQRSLIASPRSATPSRRASVIWPIIQAPSLQNSPPNCSAKSRAIDKSEKHQR